MALNRILASTVALLSSGALTAAGCSSGSATLATDPDASPFPPLGTGGAVGSACDNVHVCRPGLACVTGTCQPGRSSEDGTPCVISAECKDGLYCGPKRTCTPAGNGADGAACGSDAECKSGLRCNLVGFAAECKPEGTVDVAGKCEASAQCFAGLACAGGACAPLPPTDGVPPLGIPTWPGADCPVDDALPIKVYFRVPRGTQDGDFFRLPYPNDARLPGGHPNLSGFPTPGKELLGFDVVDRYARYVEQKTDGFSAYTTVTFRFSGEVNFDSLKQEGVIRWVDITPGAGSDISFGWSATTGRTPYVCHNALSARPPASAPLLSGHTYAILIGSGAKAASGAPLARDADLTALLASDAPGDSALAAAHAAYRPLRDWMTAKSVNASAIVGASVFTVGHVTDTPSKLATAVAGLPMPTASGWVKCGGGAVSPCPQADGDRACGSADPAFDELQALVSLPIFQKGNAPYVTPEDGGDFDLGPDGVPRVVRNEPVCLSLTIPKGAPMPGAGYPLVVHAHGTGGSYRSHILDGLASRLAAVDDGAGGQVRMAVLGIDQVSHGPRRGASTQSPDRLFYNFANPEAARGNPLQGAADVLSLSRFAKQLVIPSTVTGSEVRFSAVAFWGHSQGATEGGIALPYSPDLAGAVFSGQGAGLVEALLTKKKPYDVSQAIPVVLQDPHVGSDHPVLSVLQQAIDPADPLHHAIAIARKPIAPGSAKHVFQPFGQKDSYSPDVTETNFALAAGLGLVASAPSVSTPSEIGKLTPAALPASGNASDGARAISAFVRQYAPSGYDGHFVSFRDPTAQADTARFLADILSGKTPTIR
jgi:hypothetical protein